MFESLTEYVSGSPWTYVFLFAIAALDVIIPLVPSETSVILAGVLASTNDLNLVLVILFAAGGAILGDNIAYWIGRKVGHRLVDRWFRGERRKQVDWAHKQVQERGGYLIVIGRFNGSSLSGYCPASSEISTPTFAFAKERMYFDTGSSRDSLPSSTSIIAATEVTAFDIE